MTNKVNLLLLVLFFPLFMSGMNQIPDTTVRFMFQKKELISGVDLSLSREREERITGSFSEREKLITGNLLYRLSTRYWNFIGSKQEQLDLGFRMGPYAGTGSWFDSSEAEIIDADQTVYGIRALLSADYENRLYYDYRNYTLIAVNAWGRYDAFRKNSEGIRTDSNDVVTDFTESAYDDKLRYGFRARAAWGFGRLNPVNHYMMAEYLLDKYYPRRVFSEEELSGVAREIGRIKHSRSIGQARSSEQEIVQLNDYLRELIMLAAPSNIESDWIMGEFLPRFNGSRWEAGPFFNYYNQEPDFVYGGFAEYRYNNYVSYKRNRNLTANLSYNRYKSADWIFLKTSMEWAFYKDMDTRFSFGLSYLPGMVVNEFTDLEPVSHNFMPFAGYYRQMNANWRLDLAFAWKIADGERFMQSGPEFKLAIYKSNY